VPGTVLDTHAVKHITLCEIGMFPALSAWFIGGGRDNQQVYKNNDKCRNVYEAFCRVIYLKKELI
jgi:hypothetical protein